MDEIGVLNKLKHLILLKTGIRTITPHDCKRISLEISKATNKSVSETTIKRLYGFAATNHKFSKFTLLTLAEYVQEGQPNLVTLLHIQPNEIESADTWEQVHNNALKITQYNLRNIRQRSGIPYTFTISRKFAEHDFDEFFFSECFISTFTAPSGYGKTILLSHLTERFLADQAQIYKRSTILFMMANMILSNEIAFVNLEDRLKDQLGIQAKKSLIEFAEQHYNETGGKLIIVLDGFSELTLGTEAKFQLFESIINFLCTLEDQNSIKLILSMRSTTWIRFHRYITQSAFLKTKWFKGNYFISSDVSNVPKLTEKEVDLILSKAEAKNPNKINPKLKGQIKFPFEIQFYLQLKEEDPDFNYYAHITFFELVSRFVTEKIYKTTNYTEKVLFLKRIVHISQQTKQSDAVPKEQLIAELSAFQEVYISLLSDGILMEEKSFNELLPKEYVRFAYSPIFEYFVFVDLLEKWNSKIDQSFFRHIEEEYNSNHLSFQLLQWTLRFIIKVGDLQALSYLFHTNLTNYERKYLILFIAENLDVRNRLHPSTIHLLRDHNLHTYILKVIVNLDFIDAYYKESIDILVRLTDQEEHLLSYHSILLIFDIMSLNTSQIQNRVTLLSKFRSKDWPGNPYKIGLLIHSQLMGGHIDSRQVVEEFENTLQQQPPSEKIDLESTQSISYLLILILIFFQGDNREILRVINLISSRHPKNVLKRSPFSLLMMSSFSAVSMRSNPDRKAEQLANVLARLNSDDNYFKVPQYSGAIIKTTQARQAKNKGDYTLALELCMECLTFFKENRLNMNCLIIYNMLIEIFEECARYEKIDEYRYERLCFIEENDISPNLLSYIS